MPDIRYYPGVLEGFITQRGNAAALKAATKLRDDARARAPKKTGAGANSIDLVLDESDENGTYYTIRPGLKYMVYQNNGTGPITAPPGRVLRFQVGGVFIFRPRTRGVPAKHFMDQALAAMNVIDFDAADV